MDRNNELGIALRLAITSLLENRGGAFTTGVLEAELNSLLNSNNVEHEAKAELVSRVVRFAETYSD
jgi:hypothetical protein